MLLGTGTCPAQCSSPAAPVGPPMGAPVQSGLRSFGVQLHPSLPVLPATLLWHGTNAPGLRQQPAVVPGVTPRYRAAPWGLRAPHGDPGGLRGLCPPPTALQEDFARSKQGLHKAGLRRRRAPKPRVSPQWGQASPPHTQAEPLPTGCPGGAGPHGKQTHEGTHLCSPTAGHGRGGGS